MSTIICQICLRTDIGRPPNIDQRLAEFHDEICEYDVVPNPKFMFCVICAHQLKKFYNFQNKCRRAHKILKKNLRSKVHKYLQNKKQIPRHHFSLKVPVDLHLLIPQTLGFVTPTDKQKIFFMSSDTNDIGSLVNNTILEPVEMKSESYEDANPDVDIKNESACESYEDANPDVDIKNESACESYEDANPDVDIKNESACESYEDANPDFDIKNESASNQLEDSDKTLELETKKNYQYISFDDSCTEESIDFSDIDIDGLITFNKKSLATGTDEEELNSDDDISDSDLEDLQTLKKVKKSRQQIKKEKQNIDKLKALNATAKEKSEIQFRRKQDKIRSFLDKTVSLLDKGILDLGGITITAEMFLEMFAKMDKEELLPCRIAVKTSMESTKKIQKFVLRLYNRFDPKYESVYDIKYLTTREEKLAEFNARKDYKEYVTARYKCGLCFKGFDVKKSLDYHNKWHEPSRQYVCEICPMRFTTRKTQLSHRKQHTCLYRCKMCPLLTYSRMTAKNHFDQHKGVTYKCDVCLNEYSSHSTLNSHRLTHAELSCPHCARLFVSRLGLDYHVKSKHPEASPASAAPRVPCDQCDATFVSQHVLVKHMKQHASSKLDKNSFKCQFSRCEETFPTSADLRGHALSAGHVRSVKATYRGVRSRKDGAKPKTSRTMCTDYQSNKACPVCQEEVVMVNSLSMYRHHVNSHPDMPYVVAVNEQRFLCDECGKTFQHLWQYKVHINVHKGIKPFACDECSARFFSKSKLFFHRRCHGPRRFECDICGKAFKTKTHLNIHIIGHVGDRKFQCDICSKAFVYRGSLKAHINGVHNNIRRVRKPVHKE